MRVIKTEVYNNDICLRFLEDGSFDFIMSDMMPMSDDEICDLGKWLIDMAQGKSET